MTGLVSSSYKCCHADALSPLWSINSSIAPFRPIIFYAPCLVYPQSVLGLTKKIVWIRHVWNFYPVLDSGMAVWFKGSLHRLIISLQCRHNFIIINIEWVHVEWASIILDLKNQERLGLGGIKHPQEKEWGLRMWRLLPDIQIKLPLAQHLPSTKCQDCKLLTCNHLWEEGVAVIMILILVINWSS